LGGSGRDDDALEHLDKSHLALELVEGGEEQQVEEEMPRGEHTTWTWECSIGCQMDVGSWEMPIGGTADRARSSE